MRRVRTSPKSGMDPSVERVKVLVLGDSGVGKSAAVNLICTGKPANRARPSTIGCNVEVKLHDYKPGTNSQRTFFVELWEIGGNAGHAQARRVFYKSVHGVILVYDLTNSKSHDNLKMWLADAFSQRERAHFDAETFADLQVPVLVIGTKALQKTERRGLTIADFCGAEELLIDSFSETSHGLDPGSSNAVKLSYFFDKVIEKRYFSESIQSSPPTCVGDRRRPATSPRYLQHLD
ncbi:rab-like protein 3 [Galendromus occidentalis]|uniref:Rab-like protein 3 n=1 Tax=Galendromus occidentalis TaxID=34638 RepID=A0AAJ7L5W6_9ACAR|nr:rab-like protein 3 [Galendromus occidentalis]